MNILRANTCMSCSFKFKNGNELQCRAEPPIVTPIVTTGPGGRPVVAAHVTSFPIVQQDWWCGKWSGLARPDFVGENMETAKAS